MLWCCFDSEWHLRPHKECIFHLEVWRYCLGTSVKTCLGIFSAKNLTLLKHFKFNQRYQRPQLQCYMAKNCDNWWTLLAVPPHCRNSHHSSAWMALPPAATWQYMAVAKDDSSIKDESLSFYVDSCNWVVTNTVMSLLLTICLFKEQLRLLY